MKGDRYPNKEIYRPLCERRGWEGDWKVPSDVIPRHFLLLVTSAQHCFHFLHEGFSIQLEGKERSTGRIYVLCTYVCIPFLYASFQFRAASKMDMFLHILYRYIPILYVLCTVCAVCIVHKPILDSTSSSLPLTHWRG